MQSFEVIKANGEKEPFDLNKLRGSLQNAGARNPIIKSVVNSLDEKGFFYDGVTTKKIYREAYRLLKRNSDHVARRYKLKEALFDLGPSGYPFEIFVAEVFRRLDYKVEVGTIVKGKCVSHEIDVIAEDDHNVFMIECKFHNRKDHYCPVTTPLYIQSRFVDVDESWKSIPGYKNKKRFGYIVTNTRFTSDAITYAECMNLKLLSWDYPEKAGLKELIRRTNTHPVTSITCLTKKEKELLLKNDIVHCQQLLQHKHRFSKLNFNRNKSEKIIAEAEELCGA